MSQQKRNIVKTPKSVKTKKKIDKLIEDVIGNELNERQKEFCRNYVYDWNGTRSYLASYPNCKNDNIAAVSANRLLRNDKIQSYLTEIQKDIEKLAGISRLKVAMEYKKLSFSSMEHYANTWIEKKEFDKLTSDQKACIQEIEYKIVRKVIREYSETTDKYEQVPYDVEYVKFKIYDKKSALDSLTKYFGYAAPDKVDLSNTDGSLQDLSKYTPEQLHQMAEDSRQLEKQKKE